MATFTILNPIATGSTIEYVPGIGTPQSNTNIQSLYTITTRQQ